MFLSHFTAARHSLAPLALISIFQILYCLKPPLPPIYRKGRSLSKEYIQLIKNCSLPEDNILSSFVLEWKHNAAHDRILELAEFRNHKVLLHFVSDTEKTNLLRSKRIRTRTKAFRLAA